MENENEFYIDSDTSIYNEGNGAFIQFNPGVVKQSETVKTKNDNPFIAAKAGLTLRNLLLPVIPFSKDTLMQNRFEEALLEWLHLNNDAAPESAMSLPFIQRFQFNHKCSLRDKCKIDFTVFAIDDSALQLNIPAFIPTQSIIAPENTSSIICTITAASCILKNGIPTGNFTRSFSIPYHSVETPAKKINLRIPMPQGSLVIVAVALKYILSKKGGLQISSDSDLLPSEITASIYI